MKIRSDGTELFHADGREKANRRFSLCYERDYKIYLF